MPDFSKDEIMRYSKHLMLPEIAMKGQQKIKTARVLVIGAGGLGCPILQYLAAMGVGTIGIVDFDKVELSNLHRQILYTTDDIGKSKAPTAAQKITTANPHVSCIVFNGLIQESNASEIISQFDIIVDGSDNFLTRYLVNDICLKLNKPLVYGSILKSEGQIAVFNYNGGKNLRDIYPEPPNPEDVPSCSENGVAGFVPGIIGLYMANAVIQLILNTYSEQSLLLFDMNHFSISKLKM